MGKSTAAKIMNPTTTHLPADIIRDRYDPLGCITQNSIAVIEFEIWQFHCQRNPDEWSGEELSLADFEEYINGL